MAELSVMVLCGRAPRHLYVANRICRAVRVMAIVQETGAQWDEKRLRKALRPANLWTKGWRWLRDRRRYRGQREAKFFFDNGFARLDRPDLLHEVPHINHPDLLALAEYHQPDVIAVFGTSLIKGGLLQKDRWRIVNLHGGLSPNYRGADCTFWALHNGEPDRVGCTLHFIDEGIDTGELIAHVCPEIREGDDELTLFWRAVRDSADVYAELLRRLERGERLGAPQPGKGRLYQVRDRGWRHERALELLLRSGLLKDQGHPARVRWFLKEPVEALSPTEFETPGLG